MPFEPGPQEQESNNNNSQSPTKISTEITKAINNYNIIIEQALTQPESRIKRALLHALREDCIPPLKEALEEALKGIKKKNQDHKTIEDSLKTLERKVQSFECIQKGDHKIDESPLVLLLYLSIENGGLSVSREDSSVDKENWGRFGGIPKFLQELEFEKHTDKNGTIYWPGLPSCLMTFSPISASEKKVEVSICATVDKFDYSPLLSTCHFELRRKRIKELRKLCDEDTQKRIDETLKFSRDLEKDEWTKRFAEGDLWKGLSKDRVEAKFNGLKSHHLKANSHVPVHLPIVISTWSPDGKYKRACLLDSLRFSVLRPPEADRIEQTQQFFKGKRNFPTVTGCAEWHGFIKFMSQVEYRNRVWY